MMNTTGTAMNVLCFERSLACALSDASNAAPAADAASGYSGIAATAPDAGVPTVVVSGDRNLILTAKIDMRSKDPWATSDRAQAIASGLGGDVLNLSQSGTADTRSASLTIRVPSSRFGDALQQLKSLEGEVQTSGVSALSKTRPFASAKALSAFCAFSPSLPSISPGEN